MPKADSVIPNEMNDSHPVQSTPQRQAWFVSSSKVKNLAKAQYLYASSVNLSYKKGPDTFIFPVRNAPFEIQRSKLFIKIDRLVCLEFPQNVNRNLKEKLLQLKFQCILRENDVLNLLI